MHTIATPSAAPARRLRGFTLIECCVAMSVATILATLAAPGMQSVLQRQKLQSASAALVADLRLARDTALTRHEHVRFTVKPAAAGSCYIVHTGPADDCECGDASQPAQCTGDAHALKGAMFAPSQSVALVASSGSIVFDAARGTNTPTSTYRLVAADGREIRQIINIAGRVRGCSPQAAVAGFRAC